METEHSVLPQEDLCMMAGECGVKEGRSQCEVFAWQVHPADLSLPCSESDADLVPQGNDSRS